MPAIPTFPSDHPCLLIQSMTSTESCCSRLPSTSQLPWEKPVPRASTTTCVYPFWTRSRLTPRTLAPPPAMTPVNSDTPSNGAARSSEFATSISVSPTCGIDRAESTSVSSSFVYGVMLRTEGVFDSTARPDASAGRYTFACRTVPSLIVMGTSHSMETPGYCGVASVAASQACPSDPPVGSAEATALGTVNPTTHSPTAIVVDLRRRSRVLTKTPIFCCDDPALPPRQ